jgi:predicted ArsR family transcriptional regulator
MSPSANQPERDGPEARILEALKRHGPRTAGELAALLGRGPVAMRAHLRRLAAAGLVAHSEERRPVGRPVRRFHLTPAAAEVFVRRYDLFAVGLSEAVAAEWGDAGISRALERFCGDLGRRVEAELPPAGDRLDALAAAQSRLGFMASVERGRDGEVLVERNCPLAAVASRFPVLCEHEAALHARVLGREVSLRSCCAKGDEVCRFDVAPRADAGAGHDGAHVRPTKRGRHPPR